MGIRINQNIAAMNAYRNLSVTEGQMSKSLERLSSGFRINRAADDAAGLAISEKLRGQVKGLNQAVSNAQNGISLIQTAEGALNESHSILQRMRELAVQSANDTNTDTDRAEIQKEVNQLSQELSRIGASTEFNTKKLLDGSFENAVFQIGANEGQTLSVGVADVRGYALGAAGDATAEETQAVTDADTTQDIADGTYSVRANSDDTYDLVAGDGTVAASSADGLTYTSTAGDDTFTFTGSVTSGTVEIATGNATASASAVDNTGLEAGEYSIDGTDVNDGSGNKVGTYDAGTFTVTTTDGDAIVFGSDVSTSGFSVGGTDVSSAGAASEAITTIQSAIDTVSEERSSLGAIQNRLDHTINNLNVASENLAASESRIRDTDMAAEMMDFTRAQILSQAGTAMLAQANQVPQSVLQLLR